MRRFTSRPKPASRVARVHLADVGAVDAQAVPHAVVAREVRRRLGRRDEVVRGQAVHRRRHRDPLDLRAGVGQRVRRGLDRGLHLGLDAFADRSAPRRCRPAVPRRRARARRAAPARARRSTWSRSGSWPPITSSSSAASATDAANGPIWSSDDANAIEPVARHRAVGRLHADDAAQRRGLAHRAAGVGAERERREAGRDRRRRSAARPARHPREVVRVARRAERGVLGGAAHRELVEVRLADRDRARVAQRAARRSRRTAAASLRGSATSTWWGRPACRGCPSARSARRRAGRDRRRARPRRRSRRRAPRASSASTRLNACTSASRASICARCSSSTSRGRAPAGAHVGRDRDRRVGHGYGSSPRMRGTRKRPSSACGRGREHFVARQTRAGRRRRGTRSPAAAGARSAARRRCRAPTPAPRARGSRRARS